MKVIIYGNSGAIISRLEELVEKLAIQLVEGTPVDEITSINNKTNAMSIRDVVGPENKTETAGYKLAVFVGVAPIKEVELALEAGMKILVLLAPIELPLSHEIILGSTKKLSDTRSLEDDFKSVFEQTA